MKVEWKEKLVQLKGLEKIVQQSSFHNPCEILKMWTKDGVGDSDVDSAEISALILIVMIYINPDYNTHLKKRIFNREIFNQHLGEASFGLLH